MEPARWKSTATYAGLLALAFAGGMAASYKFGAQLDNFAYDQMSLRYQPRAWHPESVILAIDETTLAKYGGISGIRKPLADGLRIVAGVHPKAVAVDVILADNRSSAADREIDRDLSAALCATPNLVLSAELVKDRFEYPLPQFKQCAAAVGHVYANQNENDSRVRDILLDKSAGKVRLWALSLEAFRLSRGAEIVESSEGPLRVGKTDIPIHYGSWEEGTRREADGRLMPVLFIPNDYPQIPRVSLADLIEQPALAAQLRNKVVFVGLTAVTELHDRLFTPKDFKIPTSGIEINAEAFETMDQGLFRTYVQPSRVWLFSLFLLIAAGLSFRYLPGWWAYAGGLGVLAASVVTPYALFTHMRILPVAMPFLVAWFGALTAATYYHLVVRRNWRIEQASRTRYQQAMQFVTHEMRTPLSAIQGSSELISRFALTEEKRKQVADLINSESKRLARMVEVFLSVERLSAGQIELKQEAIRIQEMIGICVERARPLADRKKIAVTLEPIPDDLVFTGDRELMEYACYNLLTNAVKYSPRQTQVTISTRLDDRHIRIAVKDQGIGMDQKEVKQIFQKFYRTKKAEESGEAGTGIGLSIVQQIVEQHSGVIEVTSQPGVGSCFTLVLPASVATAVERR
ncbi:MAG TPA: CHASE2 domain-containing protein [Candidatus Sulfopaludibacter sp.]|jgi:signal transduction histidine kinase|nr:CHASE2 domain-containing protein [Candidatus Sulfopaludibacter sp.]